MVQRNEASAWPPAPQAHDDSCPEWCLHEHLGGSDDPCGFHHDGAVTTVSLCSEAVPGAPQDLFVNVSERVHQGDPPEGPRVEIQDDWRTLALLTPAEALALGEALAAAAAVALRAAAHPARQDRLEMIDLTEGSHSRTG